MVRKHPSPLGEEVWQILFPEIPPGQPHDFVPDPSLEEPGLSLARFDRAVLREDRLSLRTCGHRLRELNYPFKLLVARVIFLTNGEHIKGCEAIGELATIFNFHGDPQYCSRKIPLAAITAQPLALVHRGQRIMLVKTAEGIRGWKNSCPHMGEPLNGGARCQDQLTCPAHGWRFDLGSGNCSSGHGSGLESVPFTIEGDWILLG